MKHFAIILAFLVGAAIASIAWGIHLVKYQIDMAAIHVTRLDCDAGVGEQILIYMDSPDALKARRLSFAASNMVANFPDDVDSWDREYPYMHIKRRYAAECERLQTFLRERDAKSATNATARGQK